MIDFTKIIGFVLFSIKKPNLMSVPNNINVITWHKKFVWIFELQVKVHSVSNDRVFQKRFIFVMWQRDLKFE